MSLSLNISALSPKNNDSLLLDWSVTVKNKKIRIIPLSYIDPSSRSSYSRVLKGHYLKESWAGERNETKQNSVVKVLFIEASFCLKYSSSEELGRGKARRDWAAWQLSGVVARSAIRAPAVSNKRQTMGTLCGVGQSLSL